MRRCSWPGILQDEVIGETDIVWIARQAEALGFDSIWVAEHPAIPVNYQHFPNSADGRVPELWAHWPDPFVSLAAAAAVTSRIKLATGIALMPERDPIVTAKVVASLDVLSQGVGGGALKEETEMMVPLSACAGSGCAKMSRR